VYTVKNISVNFS